MAKKYCDFSKENPGLHLLYIKTAIRNLITIDQCIAVIHDLGNTTILDILEAMINQRKKLLDENKAYQEAEEILEIVKSISINQNTN